MANPHPIDAFFADLEALAKKHRMGDVRTGYRHLPDGRLLVSLLVEDARYPWGGGYIDADHPKRIRPRK